MFDRILHRKRKKRECRNYWQDQPRDSRGHFLSYDGRSPKAECAARENVRACRHAAMKRLEADLIAHVVRLLVESPPGVQRGITAWNVPRKGYV
jgi:hypothetical protein